jgi:hypothetical protein
LFAKIYVANNNTIKCHSRSASERESRFFLRNTGSPIKAFGDDEKLPENTMETVNTKIKGLVVITAHLKSP